MRLDKGELLVESLTKLVKEQQIKGAWVSGIGGAMWVELGFYDLLNKTYLWKKLDQVVEVTNLQGNIAWEGDTPIVHLHGTFGDVNMQSVAGHVKELEVAGTCEVLLHQWYGEGLKRFHSDKIGLKLLDL